MKRSRPVLIAIVFATTLAVVAPAHAYYLESMEPTTGVPPACIECHGTGDPGTGDVSGPHGGYSTTTSKCRVCHSVHVATGGTLLLPAATIEGTCETCHDGTGGKGVYGVVESRLGTAPASAHTIDMTNLIPGGDASSGASSTVTFNGLSGKLTCTDCHSSHGSNVVAPFTGDRARVSTSTVITSSRLLKRRPTTATSTVEFYGSDWCGGCHSGRLSGSGVSGNHPVDSRASTETPFIYEQVARVAGVNTTQTVLGTLGRDNFGYVIPDPRTSEQGGHYPICQQCHEDARRVGNVSAQQVDPSEIFAVTATLSPVPVADNPEFQVFPHESQNEAFLLESLDGLCLNCHRQQ